MRQPHQIGPLNSNNKRTSQRPALIRQPSVITRHDHSHQPNINNEKRRHTPEHRLNGRLDGLPGRSGFTGNNGYVFAAAEGETGLDESFADSFNAVVEGARVTPVGENDGAVGCGNAAGRLRNVRGLEGDGRRRYVPL